MEKKSLAKISMFLALFVLGMTQIEIGKVHAMNYVETTVYDIHYSGGDIAVDGSGNIFIVDDYSLQVKKYNSNGALQTTFGGSGTGNGKFTAIFGLALDSNGDVFVVDEGRVQKFTNAGVYQLQFAVTDAPKGVALDASDNVYVTRSSLGASIVSKYTHTGTFIASFGSYGTGNTQLRCPSNLKVDTDGDMFISDNGNARVQVWDSTGSFLYSLTGFGSGVLGNCDYPVDIDTNVSGDVFVADTNNNIVKIYDNTGVYLSSFDVEGNPYGLNVQSPVILVTSAGDTSLRRFTLDDGLPSVSISPFTNDRVYIATPTITGTAEDSMSSIWSVEYMLDSNPGVWGNCVAADGVYDELIESYSCAIPTVLSEGTYLVSVRAMDNVLNVNTGISIATYTFIVEDDAPPVLTHTPYSNNQTYDTTPVISGTAVDAVTSVATVEYELASNPGTWLLCTAIDGTFDELSEAYSCVVVSELPVGSVTMKIRATDSVAHTNGLDTQVSYTFTINSLTTPTVITGALTSLTSTSVTAAGNATGNGGTAILERGIVYSAVSTTPTTEDTKITSGMGTGVYSASLSGLLPSTLYYVRAYARNAQGTSYGSVIQFTTNTLAPTPTPTPAMPTTLQNVYFTFAKMRYNKYVSPTQLRSGDTLYFKNYDTKKLKLLQMFLYDYAKKGNQGYTKSKVTTQSMFLRTNYLLPTGKRFAYVAKFQDRATGIIATKYFVFYTTKTWLGKSVLGIKDGNGLNVESVESIMNPTESIISSTEEPVQQPERVIPPVTSLVKNSSVDSASEKQNFLSWALIAGVVAAFAFAITRKKSK